MLEEKSVAADILWGVEEIAAFVKRRPHQIYNLLGTHQLPAKKIGHKWIASKSALRRALLESTE